MLDRFRKHLTFANVCAALALMIAVAGGTAVAAGGLGRDVVKSRNIAPGEVKYSDLGTGSVMGAKLGVGGVTGPALADGSVDGSKIAAGAVGASSLGTGSVTGAKIAAGAVGASSLGTGSVTGAKIAANAVGAEKIPDDGDGNDAVNAAELDGLSGSAYQLGDGAEQVMWGYGLAYGEQTPTVVIASGQYALRCGATPSLQFIDRDGDGFDTDAWDPSHSTIADGGTRSFALPTNGMKVIEIFGAGGDLIYVSSYVSGGACTMIAHSSTNFGTILAGAGSGSTGSGSASAGGRLREATPYAR